MINLIYACGYVKLELKIKGRNSDRNRKYVQELSCRYNMHINYLNWSTQLIFWGRILGFCVPRVWRNRHSWQDTVWQC